MYTSEKNHIVRAVAHYGTL